MAYAEQSDVESRLGRSLDTDEAALVAARLSDAESLIRAKLPDLDDRITNGDLAEPVLVMVEAEAVLRVIRNPEGLIREDDSGYGYQRSQWVASGRLEILPAEWTLLGVRSRVQVLKPVWG